jgi:hypothetical protein
MSEKVRGVTRSKKSAADLFRKWLPKYLPNFACRFFGLDFNGFYNGFSTYKNRHTNSAGFLAAII